MKIRPNSGVIPSIPMGTNIAEVCRIYQQVLDYNGRVVLNHNGVSMTLTIVNEKRKDEEYVIPASYFDTKNSWPHFVFCTRHINPSAPLEMMTHLELLLLVLKERLDAAAGYAEIYGGLIRRDIQCVTDYVVYTSNCAYNANLKSRNIVVLLDPYQPGYGTELVFRDQERCIGDVMNSGGMNSPSKYAIGENSKFFNLYPGSESMLSESNKLVVAFDESGLEPTATGFGLIKNEDGDVEGYTSIFPVASAMPARLKTHLNGDAFGLINPDKAIFKQDLVLNEEGNLVTKDNTFLNAIMVYEDIELDSYYMVAGDIQVSPRIGRQTVFMNRHTQQEFDYNDPSNPERGLLVHEGHEYKSKRGYVKLGTSDGKPVYVEGVDKILVTNITNLGINNVIRIDYVAYYRSGNARITSHTGLKGITKVMSTCGDLLVPMQNGENKIVSVDIIGGVNCIKAKENTMRLAQAAFAVKYGFYTPKDGEYLDSLDEQEINAAAMSIPPVSYKIYREGKVVERTTRRYGLVQISYTEIGSHFARVKSQKLSFNAVRFMEQSKDSPLAKYILENCIDPKEKQAVLELAKCSMDKKALFANPEHLPVYNLKQIAKMFTEDDLVLSHSTLFRHTTRLLDEDFNKGFYINCGAQRPGTYVRVPSAEVLNEFCGKQSDGMYVYPGLLIEISKIIQAAIVGKALYYTIAPSLNEAKEKQNRPCAVKNYRQALTSMLYRTELGGQTLIQSLIVPKLKGINLKQVHDKYVPDGVVVVLDNEVIKELNEYVFPSSTENFESSLVNKFRPINCFTLRSPFLR